MTTQGEPTDSRIHNIARVFLEDAAAHPHRPFFVGVGYMKPHLPFIAPSHFFDMNPLDAIELPANFDSCQSSGSYYAQWQTRELNNYPDVTATGWTGDKNSGMHACDGSGVPFNRTFARELTRAYHACVSSTDHKIGELVEDLKRLSLWNKTIVIAWSDHGFKLGEHRLWQKQNLHIEDTKAPLYLRVPGLTDGGSVSTGLVEFVDIMATLGEAAGLAPLDRCPDAATGGAPWTVPRCTEGLSFLSLASVPTSSNWKRYAFTEIGICPSCPLGYSMITDTGLRFTAWVDFDEQFAVQNSSAWAATNWSMTNEKSGVEMYNHTSDPHENVNLAGNSAHAGLVREMYGALRAGWRALLPPRIP